MDCVTILYGKLNWLIVFELVFCGLGGDNTSWNMIVILLLVWMVCLNYNCIDMVYQKKKKKKQLHWYVFLFPWKKLNLSSWLLLIVQCIFLNIDSDGVGKSEDTENLEDKELKEAFKRWKSKPYALTVPLRIVTLRGSLPPSWVKVCSIIHIYMSRLLKKL